MSHAGKIARSPLKRGPLRGLIAIVSSTQRPYPSGRGPLQGRRWQRQRRPRWQRIALVSVLALLFAPSRVLFAGLGLAIAGILWPVALV
jgi:hypothetical protein